MPEIKNNFLKGKMNKDLDDRLLPPGEYRDAQNIEVLKTDGANVGVLQNAAGNSLAHTALNLSTDIDVIGTYFDEKNKRIYWFLTDNNDLYANDWYINSALTENRFHAIYYYDADPSSNTYKTAKEIVGGRFLKFSKKFKITGIAMIDDLLFWTDNKNQPRRINVTKAIANPSFYDNELKISLAKYAPYTAPILMSDTGIAATSTMSNDSNIENDYIEEEFVRFSYRFKFNDNEYSVLAPFSQIAFKHSYKSGGEYGEFNESAEIRAYESTELDGMINNANKVIIGVELPSINPNADFEIKEIEFIIKESDSTVARVLETKTLTDANISSSFYSYTYKSDTPQNALPTEQITRVFDNVPTKAKALDIVGNRLVFGNYSQNINTPLLDYSVSYGAKGTQTFTGDGSDTTFTLTIKSPVTPDQNLIPNNTNQFNVYINDVLLASTEYGYDGTTGVITFNTAPANGAVITVVLVNHEYPDSSLKQRRTYQVGVVLADIFGRQSPVLLPTTVSNSIITVPARGTAAEFNSWVGDNLKITFNAQNGKLIPDDNVYSNELSSGIYATYNPYGWYSYKIVVKQLEQDYYNVYTPGATIVDNNSYITLFGDNINKVPRLFETIGETAIAKSDVLLYPKVINTAFYTTTSSTTGTRSAATGGTTLTSAAMVRACNQYEIFNRDTTTARTFKYVPCNTSITNQTDLNNALTANSVQLAAGKKQTVWSLVFPELNADADVGFLEVKQLTFNKVADANAATGYSDIEFTDASSGQIIKTIEYNSIKLTQTLADIDEIPILGIGKLSDFNSIVIDTIQEFTRSSQVYDDAGGPFYQSENNHLIAQLPPYDITSDRLDALGVRMLFTDDTATDNTAKPDLSVTSYIKRGKYIDLAVFETLPVESTIDIFYETSTSGKINELNALETGEFTSANVTISNFAIAQDGTITAPTINAGSLQSVEYVNSVPDTNAATGYRYFAVSTNTNRTAKLTITAPSGYTNAGTNIIVSTTVQQNATSGLNTTVPLFSDLSLVSTTATGGSAASVEVTATISNNGNATITARGFRIGTTNVYGNAAVITDSSTGVGTYTHTKTDATINTSYFVWAWATNSQGTNVQGPIEITTPQLSQFTVNDWTGTISVASNGTVTTVAGNSPEVLYAGTVSANSSSTNTVQVTLGKSDGDASSYSSADNTIRIQVPTTGYTNSGTNVYLYTAVRTVTQPASTGGTYTIAQHAVPSGFSISPTGVFTQGTISVGTLNSVSLNGNTLTNGQSTNISVENSATLRTLTLNITPGGTFTNPNAADFTFNIVQPSREVASTGIPNQSTVINSTQTIDLRNYYSNTSGKFFEITSNSATSSLISASIVNNYQLQLTGQGACSDVTGTTSAGSIVIKASNEKAVTDGSVAGSTAAVSPTEAGTDSFSETVNLSVTACASPTASLTMTFNSSGSTLDGCTVTNSGTNVNTETYALSDIGTSTGNMLRFVVSKSGTSLTTNMVTVSHSPFSHTLSVSGNSVVIFFQGTYPNQSANSNINYTFTVNINTSANYVSAVGLTMTNAGYTASQSVISATGTANTNSVAMDTSTITASNSGTFTSDPVIYYQGQNPTATNYIQLTSHSSGNPFTLTASRTNNNTQIAISGTANILSADTSGYANVVLVPNTGVTNTVTGMTVHGVNVQSGGTGYHYSVNKPVANTTIPFTVSGTGNISVAVSNANVSGSVVTLNTTTGYGNFSGSCSIGTGAGSGTFTLTATPTGGTAYSITVSVQRLTVDGTTGIRGYFYSGPHLVGSTQADGYPAICDIAVGTNEIYSPSSSYNVGDAFYTTTEAAYTNGSQQGSVFAGGNNYWRVARTYAVNNAYIQLGSQTFYVQLDNNGQILNPGQITCGLNHP